MLNKTELFEAVQAFSRRTRIFYELGLLAGTIASVLLSVTVMTALSVLLARWLISPGLSRDELIGAIIMPAVMAFVFVIAGVHSTNEPRLGKLPNMARAAWRGIRAGFVVGLIIVGLSHFLGQLLLTRALYGPLEFQSRILSYCGPIPALYNMLFALPVAAGTGLFAGLNAVSAQVTYDIVTALEMK